MVLNFSFLQTCGIVHGGPGVEVLCRDLLLRHLRREMPRLVTRAVVRPTSHSAKNMRVLDFCSM